MTHDQKVNRSIESDPGMMDTMELADKDFKIALINVHQDLNENMNIMKR